MKVIIAGSRYITDYDLVEQSVKLSGFEITEVISGAATGVDQLGERWAKNHNVPVSQVRADWKQYNRRAGPVRNLRMSMIADALIAVWDGQSKGTGHMVKVALRRGLKVFVVTPGRDGVWKGEHLGR